MYTLESFFAQAKAELIRSNKDRRHPFRTMILATNDQFPGLRTIVKRNISSDLQLLAYTDSRSQKIQELKEYPTCSLLFYHPKKKLQVLFKTNAAVIESGDLYEAHKSIATKYSKDYFTIKSPGTPITTSEYAFGEQSHFALLSFTPISIQVLQLSDSQHYRAEFLLSDNWLGKWLVP